MESVHLPSVVVVRMTVSILPDNMSTASDLSRFETTSALILSDTTPPPELWSRQHVAELSHGVGPCSSNMTWATSRLPVSCSTFWPDIAMTSAFACSLSCAAPTTNGYFALRKTILRSRSANCWYPVSQPMISISSESCGYLDR